MGGGAGGSGAEALSIGMIPVAAVARMQRFFLFS
jgi:hypothetical protein